MYNRQFYISLLMFVMIPAVGYSQTCVEGDLSHQQIKGIIDKERAAGTGLPAPFEKYESTVKRQGCHYVYIEYSLPATPEKNNIFWLNQYGAIVDARGLGTSRKCPDKVFTETELTEIVKKAREQRKDLPPAFPDPKIRVDRLRCLYLYFEYALAETRGHYQVFKIDPYGELMDFSRSEP